eukprot:gene12207-13347_t
MAQKMFENMEGKSLDFFIDQDDVLNECISFEDGTIISSASSTDLSSLTPTVFPEENKDLPHFEILINAINSGDPKLMKDLLSRICCAHRLTVIKHCYDNQPIDESQSHNLPNQRLVSLPPIIGLDGFINDWMNIHDMIPDCIITAITPPRVCMQSKRESTHILGIQLDGNSLLFLSDGLNFYQSNYKCVATSPTIKTGSIILYLNEEGLIYRMDFYLEK